MIILTGRRDHHIQWIIVPLVFGETGATRAIISPCCISVVATRPEGLACRLVSLGPHEYLEGKCGAPGQPPPVPSPDYTSRLGGAPKSSPAREAKQANVGKGGYMAVFQIPRTEFVPHPMGPSEGIIYEVRDLGEIETPFGRKHKVAVKVQSLDHTMDDDDGRPFSVQKMMNLSGHEASDLYKFRCSALKVSALTEDQIRDFADTELVGIRIGYVVEHTVSTKNGNTYANISTVWRLEDQKKGELILEPQAPPTPTEGSIPDAKNEEGLPF